MNISFLNHSSPQRLKIIRVYYIQRSCNCLENQISKQLSLVSPHRQKVIAEEDDPHELKATNNSNKRVFCVWREKSRSNLAGFSLPQDRKHVSVGGLPASSRDPFKGEIDTYVLKPEHRQLHCCPFAPLQCDTADF